MPIDIDTNIRILNADSIRNILTGGNPGGGTGSSETGGLDAARATMRSIPWAASSVANAYAANASQASAIADFVRSRGAATGGGWNMNGDFWRRQMGASADASFMRTFGRDVAESGRRVVETMNMLSRAGYGAEEALRHIREYSNIGSMTTGTGWVSGRQRFIEGLARFSDRYNRIFDTNRWGGGGGSPGGDRDAQANSFARAFFRVMASRSLMGAVNLGFEYAKNPLHDNFAINAAQKTANSTINTLATTGRVDLALISGLTTLLMSNIERRNALHVQQYQFDQRSLDTRRSFAQQRSDWSFNQLFAMYSRGEQQNMLQARADRIRGKVTEYTLKDGYGNPAASFAVEEARKKYYEAIKKDQEAARIKSASAMSASGAGAATAAAGSSGTGNAAAKSATASSKDEGGSIWATIKGWFTGGNKPPAQPKEAASSGESAREARREQGKKWQEQQKAAVQEPAKPKREEAPIQPQNERMSRLAANYGGIERKLREIENAYGRALVNTVKEAQTAKGSDDIKKVQEAQQKIGDLKNLKQKLSNQSDELRQSEEQMILDSKIKSRNEAADAAASKYDSRPAGLRSGGPTKYSPVGLRSGAPTGGPRIKPVGDPKAYVDPAQTSQYHFGYLAANNSFMSKQAQEARAAYEAAMAEQTRANSLRIGDRYGTLFQRRQRLEQEDMSKKITDVINPFYYNKSGRTFTRDFDAVAEELGIEKKAGKWQRAFTVAELKNVAETSTNEQARMSANAMLGWRKKTDNLEVVKQIRAGKFKDTDLESLKEALNIAAEENIDTDKDVNFKKIKDMYAVQERRAEELEFRRFQSKYDINQVMGQYTDANRVTDVMAKQGFFIGSQVDVQDVNKDILAEVRKMMPLLTKMAGKEVGFSEVGFLTNSNFR